MSQMRDARQCLGGFPGRLAVLVAFGTRLVRGKTYEWYSSPNQPCQGSRSKGRPSTGGNSSLVRVRVRVRVRIRDRVRLRVRVKVRVRVRVRVRTRASAAARP